MSEPTVRDIVCPICATTTEGRIVLPKPSAGPKTSDLRRFAEGPDPLPLLLCSCPSCGYAGKVSDFEEHAPKREDSVTAANAGAFFSQDEWDEAHDPMLADRDPPSASTVAEQVSLHLTPRAALGHADAAVRYEHLAQLERWRGAGPLREGDAYLRAAWLHSDKRDGADDERRCRARALACYQRGVAERTWFARREDLCIIGYLIGELHRRLGDPTEAQRWYEQSVAWSSGLQHLQELVELAERQARDPRDLV
jgi:uncharacterized protein (DUF2225 family)